jgi:thioredoxin 1
MAKPSEANDTNWDTEVLKAEKPVLVDFWAPWCGPCRMVAPIVDELAEEYDGKVEFRKLNTDDNPRVAAKYGIRSIPTLLAIRDGQVTHQMVGFSGKEKLERWFAEAIAR